MTELADHLVRTHGVPFRTAHAIAARLQQATMQPGAPLGATLATISSDLLGVPLVYTDAQIAEILSPGTSSTSVRRPADRRPPKPPARWRNRASSSSRTACG